MCLWDDVRATLPSEEWPFLSAANRHAPADEQGGHRVHPRGADRRPQRGRGTAPPTGPDRDLQGKGLDGSDQLVCSPCAGDQAGCGETVHLGKIKSASFFSLEIFFFLSFYVNTERVLRELPNGGLKSLKKLRINIIIIIQIWLYRQTPSQIPRITRAEWLRYGMSLSVNLVNHQYQSFQLWIRLELDKQSYTGSARATEKEKMY